MNTEESKSRDFENLIKLSDDDLRDLYNESKIDDNMFRKVLDHKFNNMFGD